MSPSTLVDSVRTPTLLLLGAEDLRVPMEQGRAWHLWLKARGVPTELHVFGDEGHALDGPEADKMCMLLTLRFFSRWL